MNLATEPFIALWRTPRDFKAGFFTGALSLVALVGVLWLSAMLLLSPASAALDPAVGLAFTQMTADFDSLLVLAWPFIAAVVSGMWVIGIFIRLVYKAG
ncbi:hypothetical protein [Beggiatoa leptomitoformis]|uniref:Uncharacterized protein n=1 Tax=Beggiatoa leptomitoformis TaxID=288004 RepID=A0A2N9YCS7_9GAMM|nr:hypothetical protein [Beggiatoa leptomitoformis]ALG66447.1 hypothetical protein AL038_00200 [Beggiatoa leptomitoformis]AUI68272.1 hypothetical protein BLE401_05875 [Beggiatoa leptomitoformis]